METYTRLETLGKGSYGEVFRALHLRCGILYAIKKVIPRKSGTGIPSSILREVSVMRALDSRYIVKMREYFTCEDAEGKAIHFIVQELMDKDLRKFMKSRLGKNRGMGAEMAKRFLYQLLLGVAECHRKGILHRDLKPRNLLVQESSGILKICDFGLARSLAQPVHDYRHQAGTLIYLPPEVLLKSNLSTPAIDMWAVGCIYFFMLTGRALFESENALALARCIFQVLGTPKHLSFPIVERLGGWNVFPDTTGIPRSKWYEKCTPDVEAIDLLLQMLDLDHEKRITATSALRSPFFNDVRADYPSGMAYIG